MLDYDGSRHNLETVESTSKKREDIKVAKAREQMEESRRLYEVLNKELHEELPALYDSRIPFFVNTFQTLFSSEAQFHQEYSKVYTQFCELVELLAAEAAKGTYQTDANRYLSQSPFTKEKLDDEHEESAPTYVDPSSPLSSPATQIPKLNYEDNLEQAKLPEVHNDTDVAPDIHRLSHANGDNVLANDTSVYICFLFCGRTNTFTSP